MQQAARCAIVSVVQRKHSFMKQAAEVLEKLRASKSRITKTRSAVVEIIYSAKSPISVPELLGKLEKRGISVNKTTAYRELAFLIEQKFVREIDLLEGLKRYEAFAHDCHHHLVCTKCGAITCFHLHHARLEPLEKDIRKSLGFEVQTHTLEFFGICKDCR